MGLVHKPVSISLALPDPFFLPTQRQREKRGLATRDYVDANVLQSIVVYSHTYVSPDVLINSSYVWLSKEAMYRILLLTLLSNSVYTDKEDPEVHYSPVS